MDNFFANGIQEFAMYIRDRIPTDFGPEDTEKLADFLWSMLQERAEDRKSTAELLNHTFLVG